MAEEEMSGFCAADVVDGDHKVASSIHKGDIQLQRHPSGGSGAHPAAKHLVTVIDGQVVLLIKGTFLCILQIYSHLTVQFGSVARLLHIVEGEAGDDGTYRHVELGIKIQLLHKGVSVNCVHRTGDRRISTRSDSHGFLGIGNTEEGDNRRHETK